MCLGGDFCICNEVFRVAENTCSVDYVVFFHNSDKRFSALGFGARIPPNYEVGFYFQSSLFPFINDWPETFVCLCVCLSVYSSCL